jgi:molybdopterin converting factor small subunit
MRITIKLYAMLTEYLPANAEKNEARLELKDDTTINGTIEHLKLPQNLVHLVLLNGIYIQPEQLSETSLKDGDVLAIWPPVAGG